MPWDRSQPTDPKYRTKKHRRERAKLARELKTRGYLICAQPICLKQTRTITTGEPWHLGHNDAGTAYIGPCHAVCNVVDGAKRGRAKQADPTSWDL